MKLKRSTRILLGLLAVYAAVLLLCAPWISRTEFTVTAILRLRVEIVQYTAANDALPTSADQLPKQERFMDASIDGWGRPILWQIDGNIVTLTSYGRDGVPGGTGVDTDIIGEFAAKTADGKWVDDFVSWRVYPRHPRK